jgi:hypothetical protein
MKYVYILAAIFEVAVMLYVIFNKKFGTLRKMYNLAKEMRTDFSVNRLTFPHTPPTLAAIIFSLLLFVFATVIITLGFQFIKWPRMLFYLCRKRWNKIVAERRKKNCVSPELPLVYTNMVAGLLAVTSGTAWYVWKTRHDAMVRDGRIGPNEPIRVYPTFIFRHQSAQIRPEDEQFVSGWLSDFDTYIAPHCRVQKMDMLFVPFAQHNKRRRDDSREFLKQYHYARNLDGVKYRLGIQ